MSRLLAWLDSQRQLRATTSDPVPSWADFCCAGPVLSRHWHASMRCTPPRRFTPPPRAAPVIWLANDPCSDLRDLILFGSGRGNGITFSPSCEPLCQCARCPYIAVRRAVILHGHPGPPSLSQNPPGQQSCACAGCINHAPHPVSLRCLIIHQHICADDRHYYGHTKIGTYFANGRLWLSGLWRNFHNLMYKWPLITSAGCDPLV